MVNKSPHSLNSTSSLTSTPTCYVILIPGFTQAHWTWATLSFLFLQNSFSFTLLFSSVQLLSCVQLFVTPWTAARQASLCPSPTPGVYSNSCPLHHWRHPTIHPSVQFSSVAQLSPTLCDPMNHRTPSLPSPTPGVYSNSCPSVNLDSNIGKGQLWKCLLPYPLHWNSCHFVMTYKIKKVFVCFPLSNLAATNTAQFLTSSFTLL